MSPKRLGSAKRRLTWFGLSVLVACGAAGQIEGPVPTGIWGGSQGNLTVYADSATLDLPCAAGRIQGSLVALSNGGFSQSGLYASLVGPIPNGGPNWQTANFDGTRANDSLTLTVLVNGTSVGPIGLHRGTTGSFAHCQ